MLNLSWFHRVFLRELHAREIRYLLVGGHVVRYYGYTRTTKDLDIWISTQPANAIKVCELCRDVFELPHFPVEAFMSNERLVTLTLPASHAAIRRPILGARPETLAEQVGTSSELEILTTQSGVDFESCYAARVTVDADGIPVSIVSLPHLKVIKSATPARAKDQDDLAHLA